MINKQAQYPISKDSVLESVSIVDGLNYYGVQVDRHDKCRCPFHGDRRPSMKVYRNTNKYYCFVCNEGGNIIDFVMKYKGLSFGDTLKQIDKDFSLGLYQVKNRNDRIYAEDYQDEINQAAREIENQYRENYDILCKVRRVLWREYLDKEDLQLKRYIDYLDNILDDFTGESTRVLI